MTTSPLPLRYARALRNVVAAEDPGCVDAVGRELSAVAAALHDTGAVEVIFDNPSVPEEDCREVLGMLLGRIGVRETVAHFFQLLLAKGRLRYVGAIAETYAGEADRAFNRVRGTVESAMPLREETVGRVGTRLSEVLGGQVILDMRENPELIGGVSVRIGNVIYDGSARGRLGRLGAEMVEE